MTTSVLWLEWSGAGRAGRIVANASLRVGRGVGFEVPLVTDPFASREPTFIEPCEEGLRLDARGTLNGVVVRGRPVQTADIRSGESFVIGSTTFYVVAGPRPEDDTKDIRSGGPLVFRTSARELITQAGLVVAQFSTSESQAFAAVAAAFPQVASHEEVGNAVWGRNAYDRYQVHRLLQRVRLRMGDWGNSLSNVRGTGYRLLVDVRVE